MSVSLCESVAPGCFLGEDHIYSSASVLDVHYKYWESGLDNTLCSGVTVIFWKEMLLILHTVLVVYLQAKRTVNIFYL